MCIRDRDYMGKPHFDVFEKFWHQYRKLNEERGTEQYLVPYLMSKMCIRDRCEHDTGQDTG